MKRAIHILISAALVLMLVGSLTAAEDSFKGLDYPKWGFCIQIPAGSEKAEDDAVPGVVFQEQYIHDNLVYSIQVADFSEQQITDDQAVDLMLGMLSWMGQSGSGPAPERVELKTPSGIEFKGVKCTFQEYERTNPDGSKERMQLGSTLLKKTFGKGPIRTTVYLTPLAAKQKHLLVLSVNGDKDSRNKVDAAAETMAKSVKMVVLGSGPIPAPADGGK